MGKVKCERCGCIAKTLYIRETWEEKHPFDPNDKITKQRWKSVGYYCEKCGFVFVRSYEGGAAS